MHPPVARVRQTPDVGTRAAVHHEPMARLAACVAVVVLGVGLLCAPGAGARTPRVYIAVGDSVTNSGPIGAGWVDLYYRYLQADTNGGATELTKLSSGTSGLMVQPGGGVDQVIKLIDKSSNVIAVTVTTGGNDAIGGACWVAPACPFPANLTNILSRLNAALAKDPGRERVALLAYYNPESGKGSQMEATNDHTLLGADVRIDCSGSGALVGLNDDIACIGWQQGWIVVDAWPAFKAGGQPMLEGIHPSAAGHRLIATLFENACDLPAAGPGVPDPDGFLAARPANGGPGCLAAAPLGDGQIAFARFDTSAGLFIVGADGAGLHQLRPPRVRHRRRDLRRERHRSEQPQAGGRRRARASLVAERQAHRLQPPWLALLDRQLGAPPAPHHPSPAAEEAARAGQGQPAGLVARREEDRLRGEPRRLRRQHLDGRAERPRQAPPHACAPGQLRA
jgi:lysophospholipase L1-like esterase